MDVMELSEPNFVNLALFIKPRTRKAGTGSEHRMTATHSCETRIVREFIVTNCPAIYFRY
jgi:hypothetical protein